MSRRVWSPQQLVFGGAEPAGLAEREGEAIVVACAARVRWTCARCAPGSRRASGARAASAPRYAMLSATAACAGSAGARGGR